MKRVLGLLSVTLLSLATANALATEAIVKHRATLRSDPSTQRPPIATLQPEEDVELIEPSATANYYHVRTGEGDEGWVYSRSLEIVTGNTNTAQPAAAPSASPSPGEVGGAVSAIPKTWDKPDPNSTTFDGPDGHCGPTGDGGDTITNGRKNRTDVPTEYHTVTWKALQSLPYPVAGKSLTE